MTAPAGQWSVSVDITPVEMVSLPEAPSGSRHNCDQRGADKPQSYRLTRTTRSVGLSLGRFGVQFASETVQVQAAALAARAQSRNAGTGAPPATITLRSRNEASARRHPALRAYARAKGEDGPETLGLALVV